MVWDPGQMVWDLAAQMVWDRPPHQFVISSSRAAIALFQLRV